MINPRSKIAKIEETIARLKADRRRTSPNPFRGMSDSELVNYFGDSPVNGNIFPAHFTDEQALESYSLYLAGYSIEEAIKRVGE
jgi:hypothetical protein